MSTNHRTVTLHDGWEIEYSDGKPYNLQKRASIGGMDVHPIVLAKFQKGWEPDEGVANLIAAAPDLLRACKLQVANIERWLETGVPATPEESERIYEALKAAIEKAEGIA